MDTVHVQLLVRRPQRQSQPCVAVPVACPGGVLTARWPRHACACRLGAPAQRWVPWLPERRDAVGGGVHQLGARVRGCPACSPNTGGCSRGLLTPAGAHARPGLGGGTREQGRPVPPGRVRRATRVTHRPERKSKLVFFTPPVWDSLSRPNTTDTATGRQVATGGHGTPVFSPAERRRSRHPVRGAAVECRQHCRQK